MRERLDDWSNSVPAGAMAGSWKVALMSPPNVSRVRLKKAWAIRLPLNRSLLVSEADTVSTRLAAGSPGWTPRKLVVGTCRVRLPLVGGFGRAAVMTVVT